MAPIRTLMGLIVAEAETWDEFNPDKPDGAGYGWHWAYNYGYYDGGGRGYGEAGDREGNGSSNDWTSPMLHEQIPGTIELICLLVNLQKEENGEWEALDQPT